ncbi:flagellar motor switch protein FliM [Granulicella tundricola]|uniref:Flagellar motor switch protein FliM n=1 Tax=Granulicella tundricola (strain ATCC BAA-1859 / DSM 23138 / MP5ACTX9) TaxID=1198114 RepID=E8X626_GRATM|nr:flagellar motor switch protein FliM [Granulicella tundricola]ADW70910.1 flagellar motor switch protein FliM [Granulicella tundricola MP5ACTX9]
MKTIQGKSSPHAMSANSTVLPCNFRSAGRLSNESARTLTTVHETLARNLTNSLDVYLGTGLEVRLIHLEQFSMEDFKATCMSAAYMLPCSAKPSSNTLLLEMDSSLMFTVIDLLLGGSGKNPESARELTEIDEEIMEGVGSLIAQQIERAWQPVGFVLTPGKCVKPNLAHRVFPPTEKVLRIHFEVSVAGVTGALYIAFQASMASHLVRNIRADSTGKTGGVVYMPLPKLQKRILDCQFALSGDIPNLKVPVRDLARIEVGSVLMLSAPVSMPGKLTLEGKTYYEALPVRQGNNKAMQLMNAIHSKHTDVEAKEEEHHAGS